MGTGVRLPLARRAKPWSVGIGCRRGGVLGRHGPTADRLGVGLRLFRERFGAPRALVAAGGVAANTAIRGALQDVAARAQTTLIIPPPALCTDNGAMIAWAGANGWPLA